MITIIYVFSSSRSDRAFLIEKKNDLQNLAVNKNVSIGFKIHINRYDDNQHICIFILKVIQSIFN